MASMNDIQAQLNTVISLLEEIATNTTPPEDDNTLEDENT